MSTFVQPRPQDAPRSLRQDCVMLTDMLNRKMRENPGQTALEAFREVQAVVERVAKIDWKNVVLTTMENCDVADTNDRGLEFI